MVNYLIQDAQGNPLQGAEISQTVVAGWCSAINSNGSTDTSGKASIYDGCPFAATVNYTVSSPGYSSQSGSVNTAFLTGSKQVTVTLRSIAEPAPSNSDQSLWNKLTGGSGSCPNGYVLQSGQCVQESKANPFTNLFNLIKANWLLIIVLVAAFALIALLFVKPASLTSVVGAVKQ